MNNIVALDNLRKLASDFQSDVYKRDEADYVLEIADEIEREISERYVLLPCDADGEPWTLETERFIDDTGRKVKFSGLQVDREGRWKILSICVWHDPSLCRHVKPDPLKELLEELVSEARDDSRDFSVEPWCDAVRDLMGGDAS